MAISLGILTQHFQLPTHMEYQLTSIPVTIQIWKTTYLMVKTHGFPVKKTLFQVDPPLRISIYTYIHINNYKYINIPVRMYALYMEYQLTSIPLRISSKPPGPPGGSEQSPLRQRGGRQGGLRGTGLCAVPLGPSTGRTQRSVDANGVRRR